MATTNLRNSRFISASRWGGRIARDDALGERATGNRVPPTERLSRRAVRPSRRAPRSNRRREETPRTRSDLDAPEGEEGRGIRPWLWRLLLPPLRAFWQVVAWSSFSALGREEC